MRIAFLGIPGVPANWGLRDIRRSVGPTASRKATSCPSTEDLLGPSRRPAMLWADFAQGDLQR